VTPRPLIFVSAVSRELRSARQLVANTLAFLGYQPVWQEIFGTESGDLREILRRQVDQSKGLVQLVGQCYGAEPPSPDEQFGRVSYTQYEALYARERGKKVWYLFIDERFPSEPCESEPDELRNLQTAYRRRLQSDTHLFHSLTSSEALEASVLKLRDDLTHLRRGVKRWAVGVVALLVFLSAATIWLIQMQRRQSSAIQKQGEQVTAIVNRYQKMEQALVRLADVEAQSKQPGSKLSPQEQRALAYATLERELGLPAGVLDKELPAFALGLYNRSDTKPLMRARAAYALGRFDEAEKLSLDAAAQDRQAYEIARHVQEEKRKQAIEEYVLAGLAAQKHVQYARAMEHFREAEKLTDRSRTPTEWAEVQYAIARLLDDEGQYQDAENVARAVVEVRAHVLGSEHLDTLRSRVQLAVALLHEGKFIEAETNLRELVTLEEKVIGLEHPDTLSARHRLAAALLSQGKYAETEAEIRQVIKLREKVLGPEHLDTLASRNNLAVVLMAKGKYAEAEGQYREQIKLSEKVLGPEHPDTLGRRHNLAAVLDDEGKYAEAEGQYRELIKLSEKVLGSEHPDTLGRRHNLAAVLEEQGRYAEAEAENRQVLKLREKVLGPEHPDTLGSRNNLAVMHKDQGKYAEAEDEYRQVIKLTGKVLGPEHPDTLSARDNLAAVLTHEDKQAEAEVEIRSVIKLQEKSVGEENPQTFYSRDTLAVALEGQGKYAEAEAEYRSLIKLEEKVLGAENPLTLASRSGVAKTLMDQGKDAEADMREVIRLREKAIGPEHPDMLASCYDFASGLRNRGKIQEAKEFARRAAEGARKVLGPDHPSTRKYEKLLADLQAKP
jgi:tetratricopeptide (TPR) repeat protein